jgi:hypothetical protein
MTYIQKFAAVEADLISAAADGAPALHSEVFKKFASLIENADDATAIFDGVTDAIEEVKAASGWANGLNIAGAGIGLAGALAGPVMSVVKSIADRNKKSQALQKLQQAAPQLFQQNPQRAQAIFDLVFNAAPDIAANTIIMADLMTQMTSMPMLDLGTVGKLIDIAKSRAQTTQAIGPQSGLFSPHKGMMELGDKVQGMAGKIGSYKPVLNWSTEAIKKAGLTDSFTGSGTTLEQANNGTMMDQQGMGSSMMPLDAVVRELIEKQMELQQREEVLAQNEAYLQQAMQEMQQAGSQYQDMTGVDPNSGDVVPDGGPDAQTQPAPAAAPATEEPSAPAPGGAPDPAAGLEEPAPGAGAAPEALGTGAEDAGSAGLGEEQAEPAAGSDSGAAGEAAAEDGVPGDVGAVGADPANGAAPAPSPASAGAPFGVNQQAPAAAAEPDGDEAGEAASDGDGDEQLPVGEGEGMEAAGEDAPKGDGGEEGEAEDKAVPGNADGEHDISNIEQGAAAGPNTPESVEGTPEDEAHDAANKVQDGTPEDEIADAELASVLNSGGHVAGGAGAEEGAAPEASAPPMQAPPMDMGAPAMPTPAPSAPALGGNEQSITVPLRISIKIGEANSNPELAARANAYDAFSAAMSDLFTPSR